MRRLGVSALLAASSLAAEEPSAACESHPFEVAAAPEPAAAAAAAASRRRSPPADVWLPSAASRRAPAAMITGQKGVKYGLEVRKPPGAKAAAPAPKKRSVFGDDDSDEEQQGNVEQQIARQAARKQTDKKVDGCCCCGRLHVGCAGAPPLRSHPLPGHQPPPGRFTALVPPPKPASGLPSAAFVQVADLHAAALAEDAAIFDYDSHYDAIQAVRGLGGWCHMGSRIPCSCRSGRTPGSLPCRLLAARPGSWKAEHAPAAH